MRSPGSTDHAIAVVSDAVVDVVVQADGSRTTVPGGAGLNVAVGLHRLGQPVLFAAPLATDPAGRSLSAFLADEGIDLIRLPAESTGVAISIRREGGEPAYQFSESILHRRFRFDPWARRRITAAPLVVVNAFPLHDPDEVGQLEQLVRGTGVRLIIDPNVRPALAADPRSIHRQLIRLAPHTALVKVSDQDLEGLGVAADQLAAELIADGVRALVVTHSAAGASVITPDGRVGVGIAQRATPVIDTMGAGDAALARICVHLLREGLELSQRQWAEALAAGMEGAADACRQVGGIGPVEIFVDPAAEPGGTEAGHAHEVR